MSSDMHKVNHAKVTIAPGKHDPIHFEEALTPPTIKEGFGDPEHVPEAHGRDFSRKKDPGTGLSSSEATGAMGFGF
jgi:hypothetical protein